MKLKQENFLDALFVHKTIKDAAASVGITEATAYNYLKEEAFKSELSARLDVVSDLSLGKLRNLTEAATNVISEAICGDDKSRALEASKFVWNVYLKLKEQVELSDRVKKLEVTANQVLKIGDKLIYF